MTLDFDLAQILTLVVALATALGAVLVRFKAPKPTAVEEGRVELDLAQGQAQVTGEWRDLAKYWEEQFEALREAQSQTLAQVEAQRGAIALQREEIEQLRRELAEVEERLAAVTEERDALRHENDRLRERVAHLEERVKDIEG